MKHRFRIFCTTLLAFSRPYSRSMDECHKHVSTMTTLGNGWTFSDASFILFIYFYVFCLRWGDCTSTQRSLRYFRVRTKKPNRIITDYIDCFTCFTQHHSSPPEYINGSQSYQVSVHFNEPSIRKQNNPGTEGCYGLALHNLC